MRLQSGRKELLACHRFLSGCASKPSVQSARSFREIGRKHLKEAVGETRLEDPARYRREWPVEPKIRLLPPLFLAPLEQPQRLRILGRELRTTLSPKNFDKPCVCLAGG